MKVVCGLGNPGPQYEETRHNVGWWVIEQAQAAWRFPDFRKASRAWASQGVVDGHDVVLLEPLTFMNRSGAALQDFVQRPGFDAARDLLVVVDDTALDAGRIRLRAEGSAGGHNGLRSIEAALGTREYARLRVGVGAPPAGVPLADWVLGPFDGDERAAVIERLPDLVDAVRLWIAEGAAAAANRYNR